MVQASNKSVQIKSLSFTSGQFKSVVSGNEQSRVEALKELLNYPIVQRDRFGSRFWYLRPGKNKSAAEDTQPIAVGFYDELNQITDKAAKVFITSVEQQLEIYGHYTNRVNEDRPVMYLLLPSGEETGRVALVLPTEGKLRQRQIQTFEWNSTQLLKSRLPRLHFLSLPIADKALLSTPLVEWVFYDSVSTAKELAEKMAFVARQIEELIPHVYEAESKEGYLNQLFNSFQKELLPNLKVISTDEKEYSFADIYAQTIAYGLFTARVFSYERNQDDLISTEFNRQTAWELLPETNPFLRRLFQDISVRSPQELGDELIEAILEIISYLRVAKMEVILRDFHQKIDREDIVIRFYEDFLAAYKPQMRERRGVYYTPEPVVSYMVRSVDELLKDKFGKPLGIADPEVMILDPACGTGTYLLWIFQLIYKRFQKSPEALTEGLEDKSWSGYVRERLLPRIFGFELLMAPYAIAHLKLGLFLEETGYQFDNNKRLGIYLTNTLEDSVKKSETLFEEFIAEEAEKAAEIKLNSPISVVVGNPPYSGFSANLEEKVRRIVDPYRYVDGQPIYEKGALQFEKNIQEDYVKFFAFSQKIIQKVDKAIVGLITNNSFLDSATLRGLRSNLLDNFSEVKILDLHGDVDKNEIAKDGSQDKNVFDIKQGVAISLMLKLPNKKNKQKGVLQDYNILGKRQDKYNFLYKQSNKTIDWQTIDYIKPKYIFKALDKEIFEEYNIGYSILDIFDINSTGFESGKDNVLIGYQNDELKDKIYDFCQSDAKTTVKKYSIDKGWGKKIFDERKSIVQDKFFSERFTKILFTPFDIRHTFYKKDLLKTNSYSAGQHLEYGRNISLLVMRQVSIHGDFTHAFVSSLIPNNRSFYSKKGKASYFPLYLYSKKSGTLKDKYLGVNLQSSFLKEFKEKTGFEIIETGRGDFVKNCGTEDIFYYIYSVLHSNIYRKRYSNFLKTDFPRIPITRNQQLFRQLADYGEQLVQLHLMTSPKLNNLITEFVEESDRIVNIGSAKTAYSKGTVKLNKKGDRFTEVPESVWNFYVGGYQVCHKWLKDRKGRTLSDEDILHYQKIVVALKETIELMTKIDEAIPSFPIN